MRNGDLYKMQGLLKHGTPLDEIVARFGRWYSEEEILSFLQPPAPKVKRKPRRVKQEEPLHGLGSPDM